jgi:2-iminobutanoate/2-iminopropanoate deaminase
MKHQAVGFAILVFLLAASMPADTDRKHIVLPRTSEWRDLPFSDGVLVGNTLYIGGHIGQDPKTGKLAPSVEEDAKFAMNAVKQTIEAAGMSMDDLVSVQVYCSDVSFYPVFNGVYRTYFHGEYPARTFVESGKLLGGARFELLGIAVRRTK